MANKNIKEVEGGEVTTAGLTDGIELDTGASSVWIQVTNLFAQIAALAQTLTNKTLDNTTVLTIKDANLTIQDDGDTTKQAKFQASGITTATTRTYTLPDASDTLVGKATTDTLTNKTLTTPTITDLTNMNHTHNGAASGGNIWLVRYVITPSVSSNNLTLAIKDVAGNDPSATSSLIFRVGDTTYNLTAATSFTKNAGTNWCNAGSSEMNANPIDFFVYAIGETGASAGLKFGFSRIPYAVTMNDFVNTTTNEKYIAGNWTNFNATDAVTVIGRFRAQLSATASFNWSIATAKVINYPIYKTDRLLWAPTIVGYSANPTNTVYQYVIRDEWIELFIREATNGTSNATNLTMTLPFTALTLSNGAWIGTGAGFDNGAALTTAVRIAISSGGTTLTAVPNMSGTSTWTNTSTKGITGVTMKYPIG